MDRKPSIGDHGDKQQTLHAKIDQYKDGLLTYDEIIQAIPRIESNTPEFICHPELAEAFSKSGLAALIVRITVISQEIGALPGPGIWEISKTGDRMSSNLLFDGDRVSEKLAPLSGPDFGWLHPTISVELPDHSINGEELPDTFRRLKMLDNTLMTENTADIIKDMREEGTFMI